MFERARKQDGKRERAGVRVCVSTRARASERKSAGASEREHIQGQSQGHIYDTHAHIYDTYERERGRARTKGSKGEYMEPKA